MACATSRPSSGSPSTSTAPSRPTTSSRSASSPPTSTAIFTEAEAFLWTTRVHLHLLNGRASEQLTFDTQVEIAATLGYSSTEGQRSVERFMQDYFLHAKHVGDLTRIFLSGLEARHVKPRPDLGRRLQSAFAFGKGADRRRPTGSRTAASTSPTRAPSRKDPVNILRLFEEGLTTGIPIHPDALRRVAASLVADRRRASATIRRRTASSSTLLLGHNNPERALRLMNEVGVLGAFIPEFGRIVAMMQFNMYHHYTVDEHIIRTISTLSQIERGELVDDLPIATDILEQGRQPPGPLRRAPAPRHRQGLGPRPFDASAPRSPSGWRRASASTRRRPSSWSGWCSNHLLMSDIAQKRDLTDPRTARDFARAVKSPTPAEAPDRPDRLRHPRRRPRRLEQLEGDAAPRPLRRDPRGPDRRQPGAEPARARRRGAARRSPRRSPTGRRPEVEAELARHYPPYWLGFDTRTHAIFAELVRKLAEDETAMWFELDFERDATQACFAMADHPGIFARLAGALALAGANVVDARTYTTTDGIATAGLLDPGRRGQALREAPPDPAAQRRHPHAPRRDRRPRRAEGQGPGQAARARLRRADADQLRQQRLRHLHDHRGRDPRPPGPALRPRADADRQQHLDRRAIIATYGEQAVDVFYVKDLFGLKLHAESKRRTLEARLRAVIARGAGARVEPTDPAAARLPQRRRLDDG